MGRTVTSKEERCTQALERIADAYERSAAAAELQAETSRKMLDNQTQQLKTTVALEKALTNAHSK